MLSLWEIENFQKRHTVKPTRSRANALWENQNFRSGATFFKNQNFSHQTWDVYVLLIIFSTERSGNNFYMLSLWKKFFENFPITSRMYTFCSRFLVQSSVGADFQFFIANNFLTVRARMMPHTSVDVKRRPASTEVRGVVVR